MTTGTTAYDDATLERLIGAHLRGGGTATRISRMCRRPSPYGSTARLEEIDVFLSDGRELALMLKDLRPAAVLASSRNARPTALTHPAREPRVYSHLLGPRGLGARALAAVADDASGHYLVLLERVEGLQLCHVGDLSAWVDAARWLARLHVTLRDSARETLEGGSVPLLVYDQTWYRRWLDLAAVRVASEEADPARRHGFERLALRYSGAIAAFTAEPLTLLHGECYASNVLVADAAGAVIPVDWEMAAFGPAAFDVAALTSGSWPAATRRRVLAGYLDEIARLDGTRRRLSEFAALVDICRMHLAVQLLAWHRKWTPPKAQARDWLGEALAAVNS